MSQENVEIVRRMLIAFRNGDWAAAAEPLDPDIEMDTTRTPISGLDRVYNGLEEVAAFWREWLEAWGAQNYEDPELIDAGDQVVTWTTGHRIQGRGSGIEVAVPPYAWVATLRDGKVVRGTMYMDKAEALEAAGVRE
jgi:ketosteroid isomerase-like protein